MCANRRKNQNSGFKGVVQLVERRIPNAQVVGSIPATLESLMTPFFLNFAIRRCIDRKPKNAQVKCAKRKKLPTKFGQKKLVIWKISRTPSWSSIWDLCFKGYNTFKKALFSCSVAKTPKSFELNFSKPVYSRNRNIPVLEGKEINRDCVSSGEWKRNSLNWIAVFFWMKCKFQP